MKTDLLIKRMTLKGQFYSLLLALCMVLSMLPHIAMAEEVTATPSNVTIYINGSPYSLEAYKINSNNYFKLRDLASVFNNTNKKFNVVYNNSINMIELRMAEEYVPVGGELSQGERNPKIVTPVKRIVHWVETRSFGGGVEEQLEYNIALSSYTIDSSAFVKLRDLMQWLNVGVGYDNLTASIIINTNQEYVLPKYIGNPLKDGESIDYKYRKDFGAQPGSIQNRGEIVYHDGWYYSDGFKIQENSTVVPYKSDYGDYNTDNYQVYGNKLFFEGALSSSGTNQVIFSMNLDGSSVKKIITNALDNGHSITVYKGKIYANTYNYNGKNTSIVSFNLDGTGRKVLYTGNLGILKKDVGYGQRAHYIFNDRIYFLNKDNSSIYSMNLDGSDVKLISKLHNNPTTIISVYDGYIYYETQWEGLHRLKIDGTEDLCVLPENATQYAIYGDKIVFAPKSDTLGFVNSDGTGRYQFPNAIQDPKPNVIKYSSNLFVLNNKYLFAQRVLYHHDSFVPGHIELSAPMDQWDKMKDPRGWYSYTTPSVNTLTDIISFGPTFKISNGWYNLRAMNNYLYINQNGSAELRTTAIKKKFYVEHKMGNYYTIKTEDGKYLGIADHITNGVQVKTVDKEYLWLLRSENNNDIFSMRPANYGEMLLNASGQKNVDGTPIILWNHEKEDAPNHAEFRFIPVK